jgi:hypothetical protein
MKGGGDYHRRAWGAGVLSVGFGAALGVGDNLVTMSVGGEKVWLHRI